MKLPEVLKRDYVQTIIMIAAVILAVLIFWYGLKFTFRTEYPILAVASGSMEPVLYAGDLIFVEGIQNFSDIHTAPEDAENPGDILVYQGTPNLIVHRAIDKEENTDGSIVFIIHGDANPVGANEHVAEERIIGRYVGFKVPWLGNIALFFEPLEMKIAFIALWVVLLIIIELVPLGKRAKRDDTEASLYK
ncbi:MAG: signal peptidase I [Candidatus Bathyarchaeota archaeon]|jgi:signal peptidase